MSIFKKIGSGLKKFGAGAMSALSLGSYSNPWTAAGAVAASGLIGYIGQRQADARRNRLNREAAKQAMHYNQKQWQMQNEYNTPEAQMQRFKDAGLNPHLIYGQGTPGNAQGIAPYQAPNMDFSAVINPQTMLDSYFNIMQQKYDAGLTYLKSTTEQLNQFILESQGVIKFSEAQIAKIQADIAEQTFDGSLEERKAQIAYNIAHSVIEQKKAEWINMGINPTDATWIRMSMILLEQFGVSPEKIKSLFGQFAN